MPRNYWVLVTTPENFHVTSEQQFTVQGFKAKLKKRVQRMEVGDRMLFYLSRTYQFAATATVTSTCFEDHTPLWKAERGDEEYPHRVHLEPTAVLEEADFLDGMQIGPRMEYVKKWVPERWPLAFVGDLHLIPKVDFSFIEEEMKKILSARDRGSHEPATVDQPATEQVASPREGAARTATEGEPA